ncbi:MAG TPA: ribonuclease E/G, partial [Sphingomicrobium sp.]|nr:ribonuclease E/G [Sphingomicrobium sp.]
RTGVLEASTKPCPHCEGTGLMRTAASAGLSALRMLEDEAARGRGERICLRAGKEAAIYVLNKKRTELAEIEQRYAVNIEVLVDESFEGARMTVDSSGPRPVAVPRPEAAAVEEQEEVAEEQFEEEEEEEEGEEEESEALETASEGERTGRRRRRRRRGGRGRRREGGEPAETSDDEAHQAGPETALEGGEAAPAEASTEEPRQSSRRRRRRRGRGGGAELAEVQSGGTLEANVEASGEPPIEADSSPMVERPIDEQPPIAEVRPAEEPQPARRGRRKKTVAEPAAPQSHVPEDQTSDDAAAEKKPARKRRSKKAEDTSSEPSPSVEPMPLPAANNDFADDGSGEPRRGWWQRTFG